MTDVINPSASTSIIQSEFFILEESKKICHEIDIFVFSRSAKCEALVKLKKKNMNHRNLIIDNDKKKQNESTMCVV